MGRHEVIRLTMWSVTSVARRGSGGLKWVIQHEGVIPWTVSFALSNLTSQIKHVETRRTRVEGFEIGVED